MENRFHKYDQNSDEAGKQSLASAAKAINYMVEC
jgi:hypothetical protein